MAARDAPGVDALTRRLVDTPADFLAEPVVGETGLVEVAALVSDLLVAAGSPALEVDAAAALGRAATELDRNWLRCVAVAVWLLTEPTVIAAADPADLRALLLAGLRELAGCVAAPELVSDPDRREELVRRCLSGLGVIPDGETRAQAADRLGSLDSVERLKVLAETRAAEERAAAVRQAMHDQAAAEAAAKVSRE